VLFLKKYFVRTPPYISLEFCSASSNLMRLYEQNKETKSFKKRTNLGFKQNKLLFGDYAMVLKKSYNIEYLHIFNFKRLFKRYYNFKGRFLKKT